MSTQESTIERFSKGLRRCVSDRPVSTDIVCNAASQERLCKADGTAHRFIDLLLDHLVILPADCSPNPRCFAGVEDNQGGQSRQRCKVDTREDLTAITQNSTTSSIYRIKKRVTSIVNDVEIA